MGLKKVYSGLFVFTMCFGLASCDNKPKDIDLYYAYSTENCLKDWDYLKKQGEDEFETEFILEQNEPFLNRDYTLRYNLMQGENDGMQLIVRPHYYVNNFDFVLPTLKNENGDEIASSNLSVAAVWYQEVTYSLETEAMAGFYPDALIPLANYKWRRMNHIEKDMNQSFYINVKSTYDMKPGLYKGTGQLVLDGEKIDIPFEVKLYDVKMSETAHWKSSYLIWYEEIVNGERENTDNDLYLEYYNFIVNHRMSPDGFPDFMEDNPKTFADYYYQIVAKNPRISSYRLPMFSTNYNISRLENYLQALIDKNLEVRRAGDTCNFFDKLYFYVDDEPPAANYDLLRMHDKEFYELKKKLMTQLVDYPDLQDSFFHIENLVTLHFNELLVPTEERGGIQTWCPQYQHFNTPEQRANYKARQNSTDRACGENVWWYGCMDPASPYPSNHLDAKLILGRTLSWMQFDYGIEGNIYWNVCYYSKQGVNTKTGRDVWSDPMTWINCAGDGALVYPGIDYGIKGPIPTLRLESIQACSEDYEYLYYIQEKVNEFNSLNGTNLDAIELLQKYFERLFINVTPFTDTIEFEKVRTEVLGVCEKLNQNLSEGIALLQK